MADKLNNPECCGKKTEFIGVTDRGEDKFHCTICFKIDKLMNSYFCRDCKEDNQKEVPPEGGATKCRMYL